jgi:hypothetical protein
MRQCFVLCRTPEEHAEWLALPEQRSTERLGHDLQPPEFDFPQGRPEYLEEADIEAAAAAFPARSTNPVEGLLPLGTFVAVYGAESSRYVAEH